MKSNIGDVRTQAIIALALLLFGFGLVTQLRSYEQLTERLEAQSESDLVEIIDRLEGEMRSIRSELTDEQIRLMGYEDTDVGNDTIIEKTKSEIADLKVLVGEEAAVGPGIVINIRDRQRLLTGFDIRQIVEELRSSGAWAIAVNNRRIDDRASLWRQAGSVYLDGQRLKSRYRVAAVGQADLLYQAITLSRGIRDKLDTISGVTVSVRREKELTLPAMPSPKPWRWAKDAPKR